MQQIAFDKTYFHGGPHAPGGAYAEYTWEGYRAESECMADLLIQRFQPQNVLDVGCAKGFFVRALLARGVDAWGVDISQYAVADSFVSDRLKVGALGEAQLPFEDRFDLVACLGVLDYIPDIDAALAELKRLARKKIVIIAGIERDGIRISRTRAELDRAVLALGLSQDEVTEKAITKMRLAIICESALAQRRSWRSAWARFLPRFVALWLFSRRFRHPAVYVLRVG